MAPLFDVHSVGELAERLFPGRGAELTHLWRPKLIEYTQLRTLAGRYKPTAGATLSDVVAFVKTRLAGR